MRWRRIPIGTAAGAVLAVAVWAIGLEPVLELDRAAIAAGEAWRVFTGHWTHFGAEHLAWDLVVFVALGVLAEARNRAGMLACVTLAAAAISLAVLVGQPGLDAYRGLSGIDSALFGFVLAALVNDAWRAGRRRLTLVAATMGVLFLLKTAWEAATGRALLVDAEQAGFVAVPLAHLVGAAAGVAVAALQPARPLWRWRQSGRGTSRRRVIAA